MFYYQKWDEIFSKDWEGCQDRRFLSVQSLSMIGLAYKDGSEFWYQVHDILSKYLSDDTSSLGND